MKNYIFARFAPTVDIVHSLSSSSAAYRPFFYTHTYFCCVLFISLRPFHFHFSTRSPLRIFSIWSSSFVVVRRCVPISQNSYNNRLRVVVCYCVLFYLHFSSSVFSLHFSIIITIFAALAPYFGFVVIHKRDHFSWTNEMRPIFPAFELFLFFFSAFRFLFAIFSLKHIIQLSIFLLTA